LAEAAPVTLLRLRDVRLRLGRFSLEISCEIPEAVTGVFGPSGAGKTTLLEIIAGLRHVDSGTITLRERVVADPGGKIFLPPERRAIGYVPQDLALFPHKTVLENLLFGVRNRSERSEHFSHVVEVLQLSPLLARRPGSLSGGEKQRVAIGRALMCKPHLLLLDEPLANLDRTLKQSLLQLLKRTASDFRVPMVYVTHDANELAALCGNVLLIRDGKIEKSGEFSDVFESTIEPAYRPRPLKPGES
jgi:molybdate transport system ATP-binding protein